MSSFSLGDGGWAFWGKWFFLYGFLSFSLLSLPSSFFPKFSHWCKRALLRTKGLVKGVSPTSLFSLQSELHNAILSQLLGLEACPFSFLFSLSSILGELGSFLFFFLCLNLFLFLSSIFPFVEVNHSTKQNLFKSIYYSIVKCCLSSQSGWTEGGRLLFLPFLGDSRQWEPFMDEGRFLSSIRINIYGKAFLSLFFLYFFFNLFFLGRSEVKGRQPNSK